MNMTATEKIRIIAKRANVSMGDLAASTGQSRQNLSNKFNRDNLSEREMEALATALGCKVEITFILPDGSTI